MSFRSVAKTTIAVALALMLGVPSASAHSSLLTTTPANNDVLTTPPAQVQMTFNEPVGILSFMLVEPDGQKHDLTGATRGGQTVTVPLPPDLPQGTEALTWHIVSADGHPAGGTLVFSIGRITGSVAELQIDPALAFAIWLTRVLIYVGLFVGSGGLVFGVVANLPDLARRLSLGLVGLGAFAALVSIGLQGADGLGLTLAGLVDARAWVAGASTTYTWTVATVLVAYALAAISMRLPPVGQRVTAVLTLFATGLSLSLSGHASAADPQWLTRPAVLLHVTAVCFWVGSLLPLAVLLLRRGTDTEIALRRFASIIPFALLPLVLGGVVLAVVQVGAPGPAWFSPYAAILAAKLCMVLVLLLLAGWNRWRLTKPALEGSDLGRRHLLVSVRAEIVCVLVILCLVAGWRLTVPPRAIAQELAVPAEAQAMAGNLMAELTMLPGRVGAANISVDLMDANMAPANALSVKLDLEQKTASIGPIQVETQKGQDGLWRADQVVLPISGTWTVTVEARTGTFDITELTTTIEVQ